MNELIPMSSVYRSHYTSRQTCENKIVSKNINLVFSEMVLQHVLSWYIAHLVVSLKQQF